MRFSKSGYFVPALSLMLFSVMFKFGPDGVSWFWAGQPIVAGVLMATSTVFWVLLLASWRRAS